MNSFLWIYRLHTPDIEMGVREKKAFEDFFGGGSASGAAEQRGADLRVAVEISLEQAATGVEKEIKYQHHAECSSCSGSGAASGSGKIMCSTCGGVGQVASNQGFISIRRTCPSCAGSGVMIETLAPAARAKEEKGLPRKSK